MEQGFFRPTLLKIIIFVIIFAIFVPFIDYDTGLRCVTEPCGGSGLTGSLFMWLFLSYNYHIYEFHFINIIPGFILSYIVSCAVIFGINKIRKFNK